MTKNEITERIIANAKRLQSDSYCYPDVFCHKTDGWDGDWEGRALLAHCCIYNTKTKDASERSLRIAAEIVEHLNEYVNEDGYFGKAFDGEYVNEQQLSGNSWYLRGLTEYYNITKDAKTIALIKRVAERLLIKIAPYYKEYPFGKREDGGISGHPEGKLNGRWLLSSDVGCAFIMLDGITSVYAVYPTEQLKEAIDSMLERYFKIDYISSNCQTHATLSALRGVIRFAELTGREDLWNKVIEIFDLYLKHGLTINYANFNWFGKPFWTEPCAVADSLIISQKLFLHTRDSFYIKIMNRIYRNALRSGQRNNGGAGCETCLTKDANFLKMQLYEAYFCCTMRLAEGLSALKANNAVLIGEDLYFTLFDSCSFHGGDSAVTLSKTGEYEGFVDLNIEGNEIKNVYLYIPEGTELDSETEICKAGDFYMLKALNKSVRIKYKCLSREELVFGKKVRFSADDLLSRKNDGSEYTPILNAMLYKEDELKGITQYFWE